MTEFVLGQGFDLSAAASAAGTAAFTLTRNEPNLEHAGRLEVMATASPSRDDDGMAYLFDGYVSMGGELLHCLLSPPRASIVDAAANLFAGRETDGGLFALARFDPRGTGTVRTDPLGQYPVYYLRRGRDFLISNNIHLIAATARHAEIPLTRSCAPAIDNLLYGGPLGGETQFDEVRALLVGEVLHFADHGLEVADARRNDADMRPDATIDELVNDTVESTRRHIESVAAALPDAVRIADATGGSDSRTVLALLTGTAAFRGLTGRCITRYPNPDANVAALLMKHLGLQKGPFPWAVRDPIRAQTQTVKHAAHLHGGARDAVTHRPFATPDLVHFTGCFGELGGATPGSDWVNAADLPVAAPHAGPVDCLLDRRPDAARYVTPRAVAEFRQRMYDQLAVLDGSGEEREHRAAELYLRARCPAHFGLRNFFANRTMVAPDILATPSLVRLRRALPARRHQLNQAMLYVILAANKELAFLPMVKPWSESIVPPQHHPEWRSMKAVDKDTENLSGVEGRLYKPVPVWDLDELAHSASEPARIPGSRDRFAAAPAAAGNQVVISEILEAAPEGHEIWDLYDRATLEEAARREPEEFASGMAVNSVSRAAMGALWALGMEVPLQITRERTMRSLLARKL